MYSEKEKNDDEIINNSKVMRQIVTFMREHELLIMRIGSVLLLIWGIIAVHGMLLHG